MLTLSVVRYSCRFSCISSLLHRNASGAQAWLSSLIYSSFVATAIISLNGFCKESSETQIVTAKNGLGKTNCTSPLISRVLYQVFIYLQFALRNRKHQLIIIIRHCAHYSMQSFYIVVPESFMGKLESSFHQYIIQCD